MNEGRTSAKGRGRARGNPATKGRKGFRKQKDLSEKTSPGGKKKNASSANERQTPRGKGTPGKEKKTFSTPEGRGERLEGNLVRGIRKELTAGEG